MKHPTRLLRSAKEPWVVLAPLIVAQWVAVLIFALAVPHNGWLFYQGGDQTFFYTSAWGMAEGHIIESKIGYGWSYLLVPIPLVAGANVVAALPAIILLQTVVLLPVALLAVYGIAARLGGRMIGYLAAGLWVFGPYLTILLWDERYHDKYVEQYLPQALGMSGLGDFPSMVTLLVSAFFLVRYLDTRGSADVALSGLAAGFAIGIKPVNVLFLLGAALALALAVRLRGAAIFAASLLPGVLALVLWKYRGLGHLPALTPDYTAYAAAAGSTLVSATASPLDRYIDVDWSIFENNMGQLREYFWSPRALQWLPFAGVIAAARRSFPIAGLLGGWLAAYAFVRLTSTASTIEEGTFLRLFMPGLPALVLLAAAVPLLVPRTGMRLAERFPLSRSAPLRWRSPPVVAAWAVLAALPLLLFLVLKPLDGPAAAKYFENSVIVPVDGTLEVRADVTHQGRSIVWKPPKSLPARVFYRVLRSPAVGPAPDPTLPSGREGIRCLEEGFDFYGGAADCRIEMEAIGTSRGSQWLDTAPLPRGRWTYRIALAANWLDDPERGDVLLVSPPATVRIG